MNAERVHSRSASRRALLYVPLLIALAAAKCPVGRKKAQPAKAAASAIPDSADQVIYGSRSVLNDQGVLKGVLLSDTAYTYDQNSRLELKRVNLTFYTSQGVEDGTLVSRSGTYNTRLGRLEARGDVIVTRKDGRRLTTPQLVYDQVRGQVFTDSAFVLVEPSKQVTGIGFESDPKLTVFKCLRACKGVAPVAVPVK